jgi:translation initiation factor IF-3
VENGGKIVKELPVNERIKVKEVLLIGEAGERLGVMPFQQALQVAKEHSLDLVEVASTANPPVCRLLDYGKYKYQQTKKEREATRSRKTFPVREVRLRARIDDHDLESKIRLIKRLLDEGGKVKVTVFFRGREITRPELGKKVLQQVLNHLKDIAVVDQPLATEERKLCLFFSPPRVSKKVERMSQEASNAQA